MLTATTPASDVQATFCATLVDEWVRAGVTDAVVCPGSRSTPLALALAADGRLALHVHHDERAAGFVALGLGVASGRPAVVLTTSGTATVELHPAVVEAHHAKVPIIAVTADRPAELHGVGAPQTIDQNHLYGTAVRWYADPGVPEAATAGTWRPLAARTVLAATGSPPGPVQLNLPFREPLVGEAQRLPEARPGDGPWHGRPGRSGRADHGPDADEVDVDALAAACAGRRVLLVVAGAVADPEAIVDLAAVQRWPVIADPRSGCRLPAEAVVSHFDGLLRVPAFREAATPDVVLRLGSLCASKVLGQWLAGLGTATWQVGVEPDGTLFDPDGVLASVLAAEPSELCRALAVAPALRGVGAPEDWYRRWPAADADAAAAIGAVLARHPEPTEPAVARDVLAALPGDANLVVSSSMPVRDLEWYAAPRDGIRVFSNRGANGIDGVVSTGVGVALGTGRPTAVLIGDVAFLHDSTALLGAARRGVDLTVVVVDNDGGGIFEFLPQAGALDRDRFETLFGTPHGADLAALAAAHGVETVDVDRQGGVRTAVAASLATGGVRLVRIRTDRRANVSVHDEVHAAIAAALTR